MGKVDERDIYEIKRWLNDDLQNVTVLNQNLSGITVEPVTFTENGTFTAPAGKAYSPVTVNVAGGSSDFSTAEVTIEVTMPAGKTLAYLGVIAYVGQIVDEIPARSLYSKNFDIENTPETVSIILQTGYATLIDFDFYIEATDETQYHSGDMTIATSGNASYDIDSGNITVSGNCTISITVTGS